MRLALALALALGILVGLVGGAALGIHADDDVVVLAAEHGIEPSDLQAAAASVGVPPATYLHTTPPFAPVVHTPPAPVWTVWDRLQSQCEAPGLGWTANTGNGFYGGLQFTRTTWLAYGGGAYAPLAHLATREQQIAVAERVLRGQGWAAWPACSRRLGLR